jgi:hypothetical protein
MPIFRIKPRIPQCPSKDNYAGAVFRERHDLQRLLKGSVSALDEELLVIAEEFLFWEEEHRNAREEIDGAPLRTWAAIHAFTSDPSKYTLLYHILL